MAHSFWVPAFLFKMDVIPGRANSFTVTPDRLGTYVGRCAELCGTRHTRMLFDVKVVEQDEYDQHLADLADQGNTGPALGGAGRRLRAGPCSPRSREGKNDPPSPTRRRTSPSSSPSTAWAQLARILTTTDHKLIGKLYLTTSFVWFLVGGVMALVIRSELAFPGSQVVSDEVYNQLFTIHGTIMLLLFATPLFFGFANVLVPLQIGSPTSPSRGSTCWPTGSTSSAA